MTPESLSPRPRRLGRIYLARPLAIGFAVTVGGRSSVLRGRDASVSARSTTGEAEDVRVEVAVGDGTAERIPF